jgi:hypothetical protein
MASSILSKALRGQLDSTTIGLSLILIFPGWIAWKNVNVVNCLNQKYTIRSLLMVGFPAIALGLVILPQMLPFIREWLEPQKDAYLFFRPPLYLLGGSLALLATLAVGQGVDQDYGKAREVVPKGHRCW